MKKILLIMAGLALLSSCSVIQKTSSTVSLKPNVVQVPTLYELKIDEQLARKDTAWKRGLFVRENSSVEDVISCLTASIVREKNSDVLVEPQHSFKETKHLFCKRYELSISGYPAKFTNFHTATPEEYDMIYGKRISADNVSVLVNAEPQFETEKPNVAKVKKVIKSTETRISVRPRGLKFGVHLSGDIQVSARSAFLFGGGVSLGAQLNDFFYVGGGLDISSMKLSHSRSYSYYSSYSTEYSKVISFALYGDARCYFSRRRFAPFAEYRLGLNILGKGRFSDGTSKGPGVVDYMRPALGLAFGNLDLSFGCLMSIAESNFMPSFGIGFRF